MFRIGEFSKIAQVSGRLLRYYDEIGLLTPATIDSETGYRYYSAKQLPRLNRILALKELGLSLDQIARMLDENISSEEMRGMLMMKKAQIEQSLREEMARFNYVEARLQEIDREGLLSEEYDVVIKSIPSSYFFSIREMCSGISEVLHVMEEITRVLPSRVGDRSLEHFTVVMHSDIYEMDNLDIELGYTLSADLTPELTLKDGRMLQMRELPAVAQMATVVRVGGALENPYCYGNLGSWMEDNGYTFAGSGREVFLELPRNYEQPQSVAEIQIPVQKLPPEHPALLS